MKENNKLEKTTVFLMTFVLVMGFVGLGAQVYGQDSASTDSPIEVTASSVQIDITALNQSSQGIDLLNDGAVNTADSVDKSGDGNIDSPENITIRVNVTVDDSATQDEVDSLTADFNYTGAGARGDAIHGNDTAGDIQYYLSGEPSTGQTEFGNWTLLEDFGEGDNANQAVYNASLEIHNMMRYGMWGFGTYSDGWQVNCTVQVNGANYSTVQNFDVSTFVEVAVDSTTISGSAAPGQTLVMSDNVSTGERGWTTSDKITTFRINADYIFSSSMSNLEGTDPNIIPADRYANRGYNHTDDDSDLTEGVPIDSDARTHDIEPQNQVEIPIGIEADTYSGTLTHSLTNNEN